VEHTYDLRKFKRKRKVKKILTKCQLTRPLERSTIKLLEFKPIKQTSKHFFCWSNLALSCSCKTLSDYKFKSFKFKHSALRNCCFSWNAIISVSASTAFREKVHWTLVFPWLNLTTYTWWIEHFLHHKQCYWSLLKKWTILIVYKLLKLNIIHWPLYSHLDERFISQIKKVLTYWNNNRIICICMFGFTANQQSLNICNFRIE
jgi:hypothetical protein